MTLKLSLHLRSLAQHRGRNRAPYRPLFTYLGQQKQSYLCHVAQGDQGKYNKCRCRQRYCGRYRVTFVNVNDPLRKRISLNGIYLISFPFAVVNRKSRALFFICLKRKKNNHFLNDSPKSSLKGFGCGSIYGATTFSILNYPLTLENRLLIDPAHLPVLAEQLCCQATTQQWPHNLVQNINTIINS